VRKAKAKAKAKAKSKSRAQKPEDAEETIPPAKKRK